MTRGAVPLVTLKRGMPSLPFLSLRLAPNVGVNGPNPPPPTRVDERGGPWDSFTMDADSLPLLQSSLPLTIIYRKVNGAWLQHLLIAESALLRRAGAKPGFGVYALRPFRGPKSLQGSKERPGEEIGHYGGAVVASAPTQSEAMTQATSLALRGFQYLLPLRIHPHTGWHVVNGHETPVLPFLYRVNDSRGTQLLPKCHVSESGAFTAARDIPAIDTSKPLIDQAGSELSFDYGDLYWKIHSALGTAAMPIHVDAQWVAMDLDM